MFSAIPEDAKVANGSAWQLLLPFRMETLIDPFELHAPGSDPVPAPRMRPRMQSIVIDVEWDDPPPAPSSRGVRVWETE